MSALEVSRSSNIRRSGRRQSYDNHLSERALYCVRARNRRGELADESSTWRHTARAVPPNQLSSVARLRDSSTWRTPAPPAAGGHPPPQPPPTAQRRALVYLAAQRTRIEAAGGILPSSPSTNSSAAAAARATTSPPSARTRRLAVIDVRRHRRAAELLLSARRDPRDAAREGALAEFFDASTAAAHETALARRGEESVEPNPPEGASALERLRRFDAAGFNHQARALAILCVADRMDATRNLDDERRIRALEIPIAAMFGVARRANGHTADKEDSGKAWFEYITSVASAARHPVPDQAQINSRQVFAFSPRTYLPVFKMDDAELLSEREVFARGAVPSPV